jgi:acyl-CoA thioesterase FadM
MAAAGTGFNPAAGRGYYMYFPRFVGTMNLYLRLLRLLLLLPFVRRRALLEPGRIGFRVWPTDCDLNLHMNNGRYLTFMDLGRVHLLAQIGLLGGLVRRRWTPVLSAAEINFIRPVPPLRRFDLVTRLLTWDDKYFYIEQRFLAGGRLCAVAMVKGLFLHRRTRIESRAVLEMLGLDLAAPDMPEAVRHWNDLSTLKKQYLG